ncbi:hypothetical protein G4B88_003246 [Cannabis sativa]|uniref:Uncharacterized protein n=1 Tax=Cannabis sativa TaxID=3483 RepID=A0A7J6I549_CANSA|nr:hypothetical protein G4B88_003246 [Cannabis sativa]
MAMAEDGGSSSVDVGGRSSSRQNFFRWWVGEFRRLLVSFHRSSLATRNGVSFKHPWQSQVSSIDCNCTLVEIIPFIIAGDPDLETMGKALRLNKGSTLTLASISLIFITKWALYPLNNKNCIDRSWKMIHRNQYFHRDIKSGLISLLVIFDN